MFDGMSAVIGVTLVAAVILLVINVFYRFLVNQDRAAELKARVQELNAQARKAPADKQKELMKETMSAQNQMMRANMKPMMLSLVIVALLLPWMGSYYHDVDIALDDGGGYWALSSANYTVAKLNTTLRISGSGLDVSCMLPCDVKVAGNTWHATDGGDRVRMSLIVAVLPTGVPIVGGWQLGWIWWYILVSIPLAVIIRAAYGIRA